MHEKWRYKTFGFNAFINCSGGFDRLTKFEPMHSFKLLIFIASAAFSIALQGQDSLWISRGEWTDIPDSVQSIRFNSNPQWSGINSTLSRVPGESSTLFLINTDSISHTWGLQVEGEEDWELAAFDSLLIPIPAMAQGTYRFGLLDESGRVLGASGQLQVGLEGEYPLFHWNLGDWSMERMASADAGYPVDWDSPYVPEQFTINERTFPATVDDSDAFVALSLGDTCLISIANHGFMDHVFHFHGFHVTMMTSTHHPQRIGWSKDTVPIRMGEALTVRLIAYQVGLYPVHNHNLIAVTNAGFYPGGMITQIHVTP
jgi:hypothetical protein